MLQYAKETKRPTPNPTARPLFLANRPAGNAKKIKIKHASGIAYFL